uniref:NADH-ubiquinone oxidoreductase chain 6 n=1 Tax=Staphylinidae sp. BMNH 1274245 TaxID=1796569 RepID=A0A126TER2_9COLE|nr:NADH dehydrogenase subunit 6 [Staphylinidae sp. BMNH 1274245]
MKLLSEMFLIMISMSMSMLFMFLNHPMTMGLTLLIQTICISLMSGMINLNFWFSYMLFLIMVGGLLVLFMYMTSIASNELFKFSVNHMFFLIFMIILSSILFIALDHYLLDLNFQYKENMLYKNNMKFFVKFFNYPSIIIILMMMIYLFITLIATVKITKIDYGPMRQKY